MPLYRVTFEQTERVEFVLDATDPADAEARYMGDGEEEDAQVTERTVLEVTELPAPKEEPDG